MEHLIEIRLTNRRRNAKRETLRLGDGITILPLRVDDQPLRLLLAGDYAAFVDRQLHPLAAGVPHVFSDLMLIWQPPPGRRRRLVILGTEPTRNSETGHHPELCVADHLGREVPWPTGRPLVVGRAEACDIRCDDLMVSGIHCLLYREDDLVRVIDCTSANGTFVAGTRIRTALLTGPTRVRVGRQVLSLTTRAQRDLVELPSEAMRTLYGMIDRVAPSNASVLIGGESGSGKEVVARRIHERSGRTGHFVAINAAGLSPNLAASELFGHIAGTFTGAERDRDGAFIEAQGGTLFLDEVAELHPSVQAELLRVLETGRVRRLGEYMERPVDVRLLFASHANLVQLIASGSFRADLYYRLCGVPLTVPPLRERPDDLEALTMHILRSEVPPRSLAPGAWHALREHPWPGNVRELIHTLRRSAQLSDRLQLSRQDIRLADPMTQLDDSEVLVRQAIAKAYDRSGADAPATAKRLGLKIATVEKHVRDRKRAAARAGR